MRPALMELAERFVAAVERIAATLEARDHGSRRTSRKRGLRRAKAAKVVPNDLDRARAARVLRQLGYSDDDKT